MIKARANRSKFKFIYLIAIRSINKYLVWKLSIKIAFSKGVGGALADKEVIESIEKTVKKIDGLGLSVEEIDFYQDESEMLFRT